MTVVARERLSTRRRESTARRRGGTRLPSGASFGLTAGPAPATTTRAPDIDLALVLGSAGRPLPDRTRAGLERHLGHDLARLRVHDDQAAAEVCAALGSDAFALGRHVFFAAGRYDAATRTGRALLAHEARHTLDDRGVGVGADVVGCHEASAADAAARDWGVDPGDVAAVADPVSDVAVDERGRGQVDAPAGAGGGSGAGATPVVPSLHHRSTVPSGSTGTVRVVELLVRLMGSTLRADPEDRAGRVRGQLARLDDHAQEAVADRARAVLSATEFGRLAAAIAQPDPQGAQLSTPVAPVEADPRDGDRAAAHDPGQAHDHTAGHGHGGDHPGDHDHPHPHAAGASGAAGRASAPAPTTGTAAPAVAEGAPLGRPPQQAVDSAQPKVTHGGEVTVESDPHADDAPAPAPQATVPAAEQAPAASTPDAVAEAPTVTQPDAGQAEVAAGAAASAGAVAAPPQAAPSPEPEPAQDEGAMAAAEHDDRQATPDDPPAAGAELAEESPVSAGPQEEDAADGTPGADATAGPEQEPTQPGEPPEPGTAAEQAGEEPVPEPVPEPGTGTPATTPSPEPTGMAEAATVPSASAPVPGPAVAKPGAPGSAAEPVTEPAEAAGPQGSGVPDPAEAAPENPGPAGAEAAPGAAPPGGPAGACAPREAPPQPQEEAPSSGCAAGGIPAVAEPASAPAAPDVSGAPPEQALAQVGALPPSALAAALPQVAGAATATVASEREAQAGTPPTVERPSGAAAGLDVSAPVPALAPSPYAGPAGAQRVGADGARPPQPAPDAPVPAPGATSPTQGVARPQLPGEQALSQDQVARAVESVDTLPVSDPELQVDAGTVAPVDSVGDADPELITRQRTTVATQTATASAQGRRDAGAGLGEDAIRPHVPPGTLTASAPAGAAAPCPGLAPTRPPQAAAGGRHDAVAVDVVAAERSGDQIRAGVQAASGGFAQARQQSTEQRGEAQASFDQGVEGAVSTSHEEQVATRRDAIATSVRQRTEWTTEQRRAVEVSERDAASADDTGRRDLAARRREGQQAADRHLASGSNDIRAERSRAEGSAREERARGRRESRGGFLSWLGSRVAAFIDGLRDAIRAVFDAARRAVRGIISRVRDLATRAIRVARDLVVRAISVAGAALVAVGDVVLAAFPEARDRFRRTIRNGVERATAAVNAAADALERGVQALLDGLARALDCALQYLQAGYLAALDLASSAVQAALDAAQRFLDMLAEWAEIVRDVASDPVGWLRALARSAIAGVRNCLWDALKRAVKEWFNSKVEMVVGVGRAIFDVLLRGCISLGQIGRMAWDGIKAALPGILIQLLIEKLVSLIVPAGAALMLIIDGLRAAWGAAGRILAAFQKFMAFLKAVRTGQGPGAFAELLASAAIAVLDFLSNFLVSRLRGAGQGVGTTLRAMAARMGGMFRRAGGLVVRGARAAAGVVRRGFAAVRRGVVAVGRGAMSLARRGAGALRRGLTRVGRAIGRLGGGRVGRLGQALARSRVGRFATGLPGRARAFFARQRDRYRQWRQRRREQSAANAQQRLDRAVRAIRPAVAALLRRGVSGLGLQARLLAWRTQYWLRSLSVRRTADGFQVIARVNPWEQVGVGVVPRGSVLRSIVRRSMAGVINHPDVQAAAERAVTSAQAAESDMTGQTPVQLGPQTLGSLGLVAAHLQPGMPRQALRGRREHSYGQGLPTVTERRFRARDPREGVVAFPGMRSDYASLAPRVGAGDYAALHQLATGGTTSAALQANPELLTRTSHLAYGFEGRRSALAFGHAAMLTDLAERGVPRPGGGTYSLADLPQAPVGAGRAARVISGDEELRGHTIRPGGVRHPADQRPEGVRRMRAERMREINALKQRQAQLAEAWLQLQMQVAGMEFFSDQAAAEQWIYQQLLHRMNLSLSTAAALPRHSQALVARTPAGVP